MIITKLNGGFGNQMFQYAIARNLAEINRTEIKLDITAFKTYNCRIYELSNYNIIENFANYNEINQIKKNKVRLDFYIKKLLHRSLNQVNHYYIEKKEFSCDHEIFSLRGNIYLEGYWQTEKYFKNIENIIRDEFTIKTAPDEENNAILDKIKNSNAVALHVRRGDYITDPLTNRYHGVCDLDYYNKCIKILSKRIDNPHFFVFSDNSEWTKKNLRIKFPHDNVLHNGPEKGYEDIRLMSKCQHFIIANSSFSWWGAWLSHNLNKIVLAPKRWLRTDIETKDLIPNKWMRI